MSQSPTSTNVDSTSASAPTEPLTPERVEAILADFRRWVLESVPTEPAEVPAPDFSWSKLVEQLVAVRHEVQIQTRVLRQQQEQLTEVLNRGSPRPSEAPVRIDSFGAPDSVRAFVDSLIEMAEVSGRALTEIQRVLDTMERGGAEASPLPQSIDAKKKEPWWSRWLRRINRVEPRAKENCTEFAERSERTTTRWLKHLSALREGVRHSNEKVASILARHGLESIPTIGQPFDPETMEAIDVIATDETAPGVVVAEYRRGYRWQGRLIRTAQVRVNKGLPASTEEGL